ncbi:uncharacterized protein LOC128333128 isoform X3 [Hemicordylus capensis]|uniref:uncharacterized protein LOC128333128 isoform X3 n=1 Tax=Hemicordylus capensis TaxID=884348 RepID=UPI002304C825|nr:uncharacterized protein LOC128333128 isoform X3 [Hemicordylus capensis]
MERAEVILCWAEFLTSVIDGIKDAKSCESEMLSYEKDKAVDAVLESEMWQRMEEDDQAQAQSKPDCQKLRRVCRCCRKFFKTSPSSDSEKGKPPRGRFWPRSKQVEPTPAPPPTPSGGTPAVSGVTIGLTTIQEEVDRAEEIMEDVKKHPDPGFLLRLSLDAVTELTKMKPPMPFNLKAAVLNVAVSGLNQVDPGTQENMASFKKMLRGLLEEAPSVYSTIGILKELHRYIESEEPRLQALGREAYVYVLQHVARLPNVELTTHKALLRIEDDLTHHLIQSTIKDDLVLEDFNEEEESANCMSIRMERVGVVE